MRKARSSAAEAQRTGMGRKVAHLSIGMTPATTMSAFVSAKLGNTSPGQSASMNVSLMLKVWKCFVFPGCGPTLLFLAPMSALRVLDFPTFG